MGYYSDLMIRATEACGRDAAEGIKSDPMTTAQQIERAEMAAAGFQITPTLSRQGVLKELTKLGKKLANMAQPNYWSFEDRGRAAEFQPKLEAARKAYAKIAAGKDMTSALQELGKVIETGIEMNTVNVIIHSIKGFPEDWSWQIINDEIVFKPSEIDYSGYDQNSGSSRHNK